MRWRCLGSSPPVTPIRAIADELFLSIKTVSRHLSDVYTRVGRLAPRPPRSRSSTISPGVERRLKRPLARPGTASAPSRLKGTENSSSGGRAESIIDGSPRADRRASGASATRRRRRKLPVGSRSARPTAGYGPGFRAANRAARPRTGALRPFTVISPECADAGVAEALERGAADRDPARRREPLEPRGDVHRVAEDGVRTLPTTADQPDGRGAGVHADAELRPVGMPAGHRSPPPPGTAAHRARRGRRGPVAKRATFHVTMTASPM